MKEAVKLQHFNQYQKLSVYNLIVEIEGLQDLEQININKVILSDSNDRTNDISFLITLNKKLISQKLYYATKSARTERHKQKFSLLTNKPH